jgi:predicted RNA-binding protein
MLEKNMLNENYFLFLLNEENWKIVKNTNIIGTDKKDAFNEIKPRDKILVYLTGASEIKALYEVIEKYEDTSELFINKESPYRFSLNPIKFFDQKSDFHTLISRLDFIDNKEYWYSFLGGIKGTRKISLKDFNVIIKMLA